MKAIFIFGAPLRLAVLLILPTLPTAFEMEILHVNDMHSRFEQTNSWSGACTASDIENQLCFGGFARVATVIKGARKAAKEGEGPPVLVLNAGDNFQGSIYYTLFKAEIVTKFTNMLQFDALTIGNHEFDDGLAELEPYLRGIKSPIVAANVDISNCRKLRGIDFPPSTLVDVGGQMVGIIGYLTRETVTNDLTITDEITAVKKEAQRLRKKGIKIIIALGHSGYTIDQQVALLVPEIDVVVGAHTHTFLYDEKASPLPDQRDKPKGSYPTIVTQESGKRVPVVQAGANTKYIGRLTLTFNDDFKLTSFKGNPVLLDKNIPEDPDVLEQLEIWKEKLVQYTNKVVGSTSVLLDRTGCKYRECNIGNVLADALIHYREKSLSGKDIKGWTDAPIALVFAGNIRNSIDATTRNRAVTLQDIIEAIPFPNMIFLVQLKGDVLIEVLEHSVSRYDPLLVANKGRFLQVSGLQVTYNIDNPPGERVESVSARCGDCDVPEYYPLQNDQVYSILMSSYMVDGGDGYSMISEKGNIVQLGGSEITALEIFLNDKSPITTNVESRIIIKNSAVAHHS